MKTKTYTVLLILLAAGLGALSFMALKGKDSAAPEITIPDTQITYWEEIPEKALLKGVTAKDDKDGDVSDRIFVDRVIKTPDGKTAIVTYAVMDKAHNVAKENRSLPVERSKKAEDPKDIVKADKAEKDEKKQEDKEDKNAKNDKEETGIYPSDPKAYGEGRPVIQVKEKTLKVKKGESVNLMACIEHFYSPDDDGEKNRSYMASHTSIRIDGTSVGVEYTPKETGEETVEYSTVDQAGNYSVATEMTLVVE